MPNCPSCGNSMEPDARFCNICGAPVTAAVQGSRLPPMRGVFAAPPYVRCTRCGKIVPEGYKFCNVCGTPALEKEAFGRKLALERVAQDIKKKHGAVALVTIWLSVLMLVAVLTCLFLLFANLLFQDWQGFAHETLPVVLLVAVPALLALFTLVWGGSRSGAFNKANMTYVQYKHILEENGILPRTFFDPLPGEPPKAGEVPAGGNAPRKPMSPAALIVMLSVLLAFVTAASVWIGVDGIGSGSSSAWDGGSGSSGSSLHGDYLDGKVYAAQGSSSGGMYTMGEALYFEDGTVYFGTEGMTASEIKESSGLFSPYDDVSYTISGTTITISAGGYTMKYRYNASSDTITGTGSGGDSVFYRVY